MTSHVVGLLIASSIPLAFSVTARAEQHLAFERSKAIWVANTDGANAKKIVNGSAPSISPDGTRIAFQTEVGLGNEGRKIAIVDVATKEVTTLQQIPGEDFQRPVWSPDGQFLLFAVRAGDDWNLAMAKTDGTGFRYIKKASSQKNTLYSACWAADSRSIYAQDLRNHYQLNLNGSELKRWNLASLLPGFSVTSAANISPSPDGKQQLLIDAESETEPVGDTRFDLAVSLWIIDLDAEKAERLTSVGLMARHGCWIDANHVAASTQSIKEKQPSISVISLPGKARKIILKNAQDPSASLTSPK